MVDYIDFMRLNRLHEAGGFLWRAPSTTSSSCAAIRIRLIAARA
jgi:hypothetical protein